MMGITPPVEGGSERHIYEISSRIKEVSVLTQKGSICKNKIELPITKTPTFLRNILFFALAKAYLFFLILKFKKKHNIIHIHENLFYFLIPFLKLRYKVIVTVHGLRGFRFYDNKFLWIFFKMGLKFADKIISVSLPDKDILDKEFDNVVYIPNGVNIEDYDKIKKKAERKIKFIGRIHEQKGIIYLLKTFEKINQSYPEYKLEVIGDDTTKYAIKMKNRFSNPNIIWKGFVLNRKKLFSEMASAEILVFPSLWEALPWPALLEGLASGRAVIASNLKGMTRVFKDRKNIMLAKPGNARSIAEKIKYLIENKNKAKIIGVNGKNAAKKYSWSKIALKVRGVYSA